MGIFFSKPSGQLSASDRTAPSGRLAYQVGAYSPGGSTSAFFQDRTAGYAAAAASAAYTAHVDDDNYDDGGGHEVDYSRAQSASAAARHAPPRSSGIGTERVARERQWHPGGGKSFGSYKCDCGNRWSSAHSWADTAQACVACGEDVFPYRQRPIKQRAFANDEGPSRPHREDLCGKCQELGRSCTLIMEPSGSAKYPNDVVVRGLPLTITEPELLRIFRPYGSILRIYIPSPRSEYPSRIAFITFQNPKVALRKFKAVDVSTRTPNCRS